MNRPTTLILICILLLSSQMLLNSCKKNGNTTTDFTDSVLYKFDYSADRYYVGDTIRFVSTAPEGSSLLWDFGDGHTSKEFKPYHIYTYGGPYTVSLTGKNIKTITKTITIIQYSIQYSGNPVCVGRNVNFTSTVPAGSTFLWDFGDSTFSTDQFPSHIYSHRGSYNVSLVFDGDSTRIIKYPIAIYISAYPTNISPIAGMKLWHHDYYGLYYPSGIHVFNTYGDTSFAINYIDDFTLSVWGNQLNYDYSSGDSVFYFHGNRRLSYNINSHAISYDSIHYPPPVSVGHNPIDYFSDRYYTP